MGKAIEVIAQERGHEIVGRISIENAADLSNYTAENTDVAIEFSQPTSAVSNISYCINNGIAVLSGTTGWLDNYSEVEKLCRNEQGAFLYASNYSIGVNLFFQMNEYLAKLMNSQGYQVSMQEIHHTQKLDAPSGTAISLAEGIINNSDQYKGWKLGTSTNEGIGIEARREDPAPGTHSITYTSEIDDIEIKHTAHSRKGFALGAILVAEWLPGKKGVFSMSDFLNEIKK